MKLFTLIAGYAAGLAVAMKYRKDNGTSKLDKNMPEKGTLNTFIEEVVDIHKSAFADVKGFVKENFDDVENFDDLQKKVSGLVSSFSENIELHIANAKKSGTLKKDELLKVASDLYESHESTLEKAKTKAASFVDVPEATIDSWFRNAQNDLVAAYRAIQSKFIDVVEDDAIQKDTTKDSVTKKSTARKSE